MDIGITVNLGEGCKDNVGVKDGDLLGVFVVVGPVDKEGTEDGEVLGLFVDVCPLDGDLIGDPETDCSELGCDDGLFDEEGNTEGTVQGPHPEGMVERPPRKAR